MIVIENCFNRALVSCHSSLNIRRIASFMSSHRAGIPDKLNNRRVIPLSDVIDGIY